MDLSTTVLLGVVGLLAVNQLLMRVVELWSVRPLFYGIQVVNVATGTLVIALGLPGFEHVRPVSWFLGLMFFWRVIQNNRIRVAQLEEAIAQERRAALRPGD